MDLGLEPVWNCVKIQVLLTGWINKTRVSYIAFFFRFLGGNRIKEIPERAFENMPDLKVMYVTTES